MQMIKEKLSVGAVGIQKVLEFHSFPKRLPFFTVWNFPEFSRRN